MRLKLDGQRCLLFSGLVLLSFLLLPFVPEGKAESRILLIFYAVLMLMVPYVFRRDLRILLLLLGTGCVLGAVNAYALLYERSGSAALYRFGLAADLLGVGIELFWLAFVLKSSILIRKFREPIFGCVLAYLLLGTVFGNIYYVLNLYAPGGFACVGGGEVTHVDMLYFSFITLSTCGFGDIVPVTAGARMLTVLETICGVMYVALFIGKVISEQSFFPRVKAGGES